MERIPVYARVLGTLLAVVTVPVLVLGVLAATVSALVTTAHVHRATAYPVGDAPRLRLDVRYSDVIIEAGADGRITVDEDQTAGSITRATAGWAVNQTRVSFSRQDNGVLVRTIGALNPGLVLKWSGVLRVQVPPRTDLDVTCLGDLTVSGVDGNVRIQPASGSGAKTTLRHVALRGNSTVDGGTGSIRLDDVTVSGTATVKSHAGDVVFVGSLLPGGNSLNVIGGGQSGVSITLPHPTDARAVVATNSGHLNADPIWHFATARGPQTKTWSADLSPKPSGSITVTTDAGNVDFGTR